jgi:putative endonuclease
MQHKEGTWEGFTAAYDFEGYEDIRKAIAREKQRKGWRREKKLNLIRTINPVQRPCTDLGMEDDYSA